MGEVLPQNGLKVPAVIGCLNIRAVIVGIVSQVEYLGQGAEVLQVYSQSIAPPPFQVQP